MIRLAPRLAVPVLLLLAGCSVPSVPTGFTNVGAPPTLQGTVTNPSANLRVGLLGQSPNGGGQQELVSTSARSGSYSLTLPPSPPFNMMSDDTSSWVFVLQAYQDNNNNGQYDSGDTLTNAASQNGTFRFFTDAGAPGTYQAGWNVYTNGTYSQAFSTAFNLQ